MRKRHSRLLRAAFVTVGDTSRLTGGYLYHARVFERLGDLGVEVAEVVPCGASVDGQKSGVSKLADFDPRAFDVVVVDMLARVVAAPFVEAWMEHRPVVAMVHELPSVAAPDETPEEESASENILLGADLVITVSRHGASILEGRGVPEERIRVVSPGFDGFETGMGFRLSSEVEGRAIPHTKTPLSPNEIPTHEAERNPSGGSEAASYTSPETLRAMCVSQWIPRKGILELVEAWRMANVPNAGLELVGDTDADAEYRSRVMEAVGDEASISVRGKLDDASLARAYADSHIFVLPSRFEGYGIVYAEALSFGLPVVACDVEPVTEVVGERAGIFVEAGDVEGLSDAMRTILSDESLRTRMSDAALLRARELPRWSDTARGFADVLREAVGSVSEQNRRSWNEAVRAHERHRKNLAAFLAGGGSTLFPEEKKLLGDVSGKSVAHLMCGAGGDAVSLASLGASVTGVDMSDEAVHAAKRLSKESGIHAAFERAEVCEWLEKAGRRFDVVFASYGVICWISDPERWAKGIAGVLRPGGRFVIVEFHPFAAMFDSGWKLARNHISDGAERDEGGVGDYVGDSGGGLVPSRFVEGVGSFENPEACHLFRWGLGDVVSAVAGAGMEVEVLEEYPYSNGERNFAGMREGDGRRMYPPEGFPSVPLMYGLSAVAAPLP